MTPQEAHAAQEAGAVVLDLRTPRPFSEEHVEGALNVQFNRADLVDRTEMVLPRDLPVVVHAEPEAIARVAAKLLSEAGFHVKGHLEGGLAAWKEAGLPTATLPTLGVEELKASLDGVQVVDAREGFEYRYAHIAGAHLLPWTEAWQDAGSVPEGRPLAVVCGDEVRSALVASILSREGRDVSLVLGGMVDWLDRGYPVEKGASAKA